MFSQSTELIGFIILLSFVSGSSDCHFSYKFLIALFQYPLESIFNLNDLGWCTTPYNSSYSKNLLDDLKHACELELYIKMLFSSRILAIF